MKVIKRPDINWAPQHTCNYCDAVLEIDRSDVSYHYVPGDIRDPSYETYEVKCAVCGNIIIIPTETIPKIIRLEAQKRG